MRYIAAIAFALLGLLELVIRLVVLTVLGLSVVGWIVIIELDEETKTLCSSKLWTFIPELAK